jgi:cytochrome c oxidase subunit 4
MSEQLHNTSELHPAEALRTYFVIFYWLMGLLVLTVIAGRIDLDRIFDGLNAMVALTIATAKALLVILFFMHVKQSSKLTWMFSCAAFIWLIILLALTFNDYATRQKIEPIVRETSTTPQAPTPERGAVTGHDVR